MMEAGIEISKEASNKDMVWIGMDANSAMDTELDMVMVGGTQEGKRARQNKLKRNGEPFRAWVDWMDLQDVWRDRHGDQPEYTRNSWEDKEEGTGEQGKASYRIDYIMTNDLMTHMTKQTGIIPTTQFRWSSDHKITWTEMEGWSSLKQTLKRLQKRQMYDLRDVSKYKWELKTSVCEIIRQAKYLQESIASVENKVQLWMKDNIKKTKKYKSFSEKIKMTDDGIRWNSVMDTIIEAHKERNVQKARVYLQKAIEFALTLPIQDKVNKDKLKEINMVISKGEMSQIVLPMWLNRAKRIVGKELKKVIWGGNKLASQVWAAEVEGGSAYMPWEKLVFNQGKAWKLPELGLVSLMNQNKQVVVGIEKMEVILNYMKNQWAVKSPQVRKDYVFQTRATEEGRKLINDEIIWEEVRRMARKLKKEKSPGSNLIPNEAWKHLDKEEYMWIAEKFNMIINGEEEIPKDWKEMVIKWIHKKDSVLELSNYRPIALGNTMAKLFMKVLTDRVEKIAEKEKLISGEQQGFRTDRSCMGALFILRRMAAKASKEGKSFMVASLDISKAYDTVNHDTLWAVLEGKGLQGKWLNTIKDMYTNNIILSDTTEGMSRGIDMKQGIRQGCPMSPILFALYMDWVTEAIKNSQIHIPGEPSMLAYADDILVWGYSKEEMQAKLEITIKSVEELGLKISCKKSLIQINNWGINKYPEIYETKDWVINNCETEVAIPKIKPTENFKYLGIWMNADSDCQENLNKLEEKVKGRLDIIEALKVNPLTKAMLIKSRIVSVIDYSLGIHNAPKEWIAKIDSRIGNIISKAMGRMTNCRRDLLYESMEMGGLGMIRLQDQYQKNRARVIVQLIKSGERTKERGQEPWIVNMIREELAMDKPNMDIIMDLKEILDKLKVKMIYREKEEMEQRCKLAKWAYTAGQQSKVVTTNGYKGVYHQGMHIVITWKKVEAINIAILEWFQQLAEGNMAELGCKIDKYVEDRKVLEKMHHIDTHTGIQLGDAMMQWIMDDKERWGEIITNLSDRQGIYQIYRGTASQASTTCKAGLMVNTVALQVTWEE